MFAQCCPPYLALLAGVQGQQPLYLIDESHLQLSSSDGDDARGDFVITTDSLTDSRLTHLTSLSTYPI